MLRRGSAFAGGVEFQFKNTRLAGLNGFRHGCYGNASAAGGAIETEGHRLVGVVFQFERTGEFLTGIDNAEIVLEKKRSLKRAFHRGVNGRFSF